MTAEDRSALEQLIFSKEFLRTEDPGRKTQDIVFDLRTLKAVFESMKKFDIDYLDYPIMSGKESIVFKAYSKKKPIVVKIFKMSTLRFSKLYMYVQGDRRFEHEKKDRSRIVYLWARKEYVNLKTARECHINVPMPIGFHQNIIVMQYLGTNASPAPELRKSNIDMANAFSQVRESMRLLYTKAELVHADLSEYNMLIYRGKVYMIDFGQSVSIEHPSAMIFLERDVKNVCNFFNKKEVKCNVNDLLSFVTGEAE
jgi:RIO kinase 1